MIVFAAIVPHPLESIPGIASSEDYSVIKKTLQAFEKLKKDLEQASINTLIIISPHARMDRFAFVINSSSTLTGSFEKYGISSAYSYENNIDFIERLAFSCQISESPTHLHASFLDHGTLITLYHLARNIDCKVVHLSFSMMDYQRHYNYGDSIRLLIDKGFGGRVAIIASGDLSHRLTPNAPAGFSPKAQDFDRKVIHLLGSGDVTSLVNLHEDEALEVAECGLRSILILLGALNGNKNSKFKLVCYEAPFGVGYLTARLL